MGCSLVGVAPRQRTAVRTEVPQVGAWMLYSTWELGVCIANSTIERHPLFLYESAPTVPSSGSQPRSNAPEVMLPASQPRSAQV